MIIKKVHICSSFDGCELNSFMLTKIKQYIDGNGFVLVSHPQDSDLIIIGTCVSTAFHRENAIQFISDCKKRYGQGRKIIVSGCLAKVVNREEKSITYIGPKELEKFDEILGCENSISKFEGNLMAGEFCANARRNPKEYFIEISLGCVNACSYCLIKKAKGYVKSKPVGKIISEFKDGLNRGFARFILLADDCGSYGADIGKDFCDLLREIARLKKHREEFEIVINYFEPSRLIKLYPKLKPIINHLNIQFICIPVQSGDDRILKLMNRNYKIMKVIKIVKDIKKISPTTKLHTHFIPCFPTETRDEFFNSIDKAKFFDSVSFSFFVDFEGVPSSKLTRVGSKEYKYRMFYVMDLVSKNQKAYGLGTVRTPEQERYISYKIKKLVKERLAGTGKWVSITGLCNNNCIFCLDGDKTGKFNKNKEEVMKEIDLNRRDGAARLVLSGGEPTIHPDIVDFVKYGKRKGYKRVQMITNGRMFVYKAFVASLKNAGLDEAVFSLHGHTRDIHEAMTGAPGSFSQIVQGIENAIKAGFVVSAYTTVTKINFKYLPQIICFAHSLGITQINLMRVIPAGNAWKNRDSVMCSIEDISPFVHEGLLAGIDKVISVMSDAMPYCRMKGYEQYVAERIVPETKMRDRDVGSAIKNFEKARLNKGALKFFRCKECYYNDICEEYWKEQLGKNVQ
ncbi:MAG: radical SAM protein [Spirochaetes bacterium]|nr:radical SAM protein [Spirochaetota bacterium]